MVLDSLQGQTDAFLRAAEVRAPALKEEEWECFSEAFGDALNFFFFDRGGRYDLSIEYFVFRFILRADAYLKKQMPWAEEEGSLRKTFRVESLLAKRFAKGLQRHAPLACLRGKQDSSLSQLWDR